MSLLATILDRLSGFNELKTRIGELAVQNADLRKAVLEQQKDIASLQGQLKALIQIQSQAGKR